MLPLQEILNQNRGALPSAAEKDYCLTWLLHGISLSPLNKILIFYGGTALKKIYFPTFRLSEDLDFFTNDTPSKNLILNAFEGLFPDLQEKNNITFSLAEETISSTKDRLQFFIQYDGYPEIPPPKQIKIDLLLGQEPIEPAKFSELLSLYRDQDQTHGQLKTYSLEALTAEKISAILDSARKEPRDIYDLAYLVQHTKLSRDKVRSCLLNRLGFIPTFTTLFSSLNSEVYHRRWDSRLKNQVVDLENIDEVIRKLNKKINGIL